MIGRLVALILLSSLCHTHEFPKQMPLASAELGADLTLMCLVPGNEFGLFYWYKQKFGYMVQTIASGSFDIITRQGQFNNSRFKVNKEVGNYTLLIRTVTKEDEATYFCQAGSAYTMKIINSTVLVINDHKYLQKSNYVLQSPEAASVLQGNPVTLHCSLLSQNKENRDPCSDEHSVYWFRSGSTGYDQGIIYTGDNNSENRERRSCIYRFSKTIQNTYDAGIYYCAVVTCEEILFGKGTEVGIRNGNELWPLLTLGILLACCVIIIILLTIFRQYLVCQSGIGNSTDFTHDDWVISAENQPSNVNGETETLNYVVLDFPSRRPKRVRNNVELPEQSLYAFMKN